MYTFSLTSAFFIIQNFRSDGKSSKYQLKYLDNTVFLVRMYVLSFLYFAASLAAGR